jgi:hypothetical protein
MIAVTATTSIYRGQSLTISSDRIFAGVAGFDAA